MGKKKQMLKKQNKKLILWSITLIVLCITCLAGALFYAGYWLKSDHKPEPADAIIILAGSYERPFYAADLYLKKYASQVYISTPVRENGQKILDDFGVFMPHAEDIYRQILLKKGVPDSNISFLEGHAISTVAEAVKIRNMFINKKVKLLIITSPFHVRRAELIFKRELSPGSGIKFIVLATPYELFKEKWWEDQNSARNVLLEIVKIFFYLIGGRFNSASSNNSV